MEYEYMLTTIDNPYDPFERFTEWYLYDIEKGYNTCSYLARIVESSSEFTQKEEREAIENAIDRIIEIDPFNIYKKVRCVLEDEKLPQYFEKDEYIDENRTNRLLIEDEIDKKT